VAPACGGPATADLGALAPPTVDALLRSTPDDGFVLWGDWQIPEMRFLYPMWMSHPAELDALYKFSYEQLTDLPPPSTAKLDAALAASDMVRAEVEARGVVDAVYAMPPVPAAKHSAVLARAVRVIEDRAGGSDPRAASRDFDALKAHLRKGIPDGWSRGALQQPPPAWAALDAEVNAWLAKYPGHPLADMVRLMKVRLRYFQGDADGAWAQALALYPSRRVRSLAEMRYLLLQEQGPSGAVLASIHDMELITALQPAQSLDANAWSALWQRAALAPPATRTNLEERLLVWAASHASSGLPGAFPSRPENPSPLWGKVRAVALIGAKRFDEALRQLATLPSDDEVALLKVQVEMQRGHPERVAALSEVPGDGRAYILAVLLDDAAVATLCQSADPHVREPACLERAARLASAGKWSEGEALVRAIDAQKAALWHEAAQYASRPDGDLALARFLAGHHGEVFGLDSALYRSYTWEEEGLPAGSPEKARIDAAVERWSERWLALEAYTRWLGSHTGARDARAVLGEADDVYNRMINWAGATYLFATIAPSSSTMKELRRLGAVIRARH
jgi:hypothetical protein